jgi:topoisomerase-4 subunit A
MYLSDNPNGEVETLTIFCTSIGRTSKKKFEFNFAHLAIKGCSAKGNILTKHSIYKVPLKEQGISTLAKVELWYDKCIGH